MYLEDYNPEEILETLKEFENNKSSDIPIRVIKKSAHVFDEKLSE